MWPVNRGNFTSSVPIWMTFLFLAYLLWIELSTLLNRSGEREHSCLILNFRGKAACLSSGLLFVCLFICLIDCCRMCPCQRSASGVDLQSFQVFSEPMTFPWMWSDFLIFPVQAVGFEHLSLEMFDSQKKKKQGMKGEDPHRCWPFKSPGSPFSQRVLQQWHPDSVPAPPQLQAAITTLIPNIWKLMSLLPNLAPTSSVQADPAMQEWLPDSELDG